MMSQKAVEEKSGIIIAQPVKEKMSKVAEEKMIKKNRKKG